MYIIDNSFFLIAVFFVVFTITLIYHKVKLQYFIIINNYLECL